MTARAPVAFELPELGPSLGRLVAPAPVPAGTPVHWIALDDLRLALVNQLFDLAGDARRWAVEGDRDLALATLNREAWTGLWDRTIASIADRAAQAITARLLGAAAESRLPRRARGALPLGPEEIRSLRARLRRGSAPFDRALEQLEAATHGVRATQPTAEARSAWETAITTVARRLEAAWIALDRELHREWVEWEREVQAIRAWRRPGWPVWTVGAILLLLALWVGLMLGGYLNVPPPLTGAAEWVWERWN
jgi:hypothetical protein